MTFAQYLRLVRDAVQKQQPSLAKEIVYPRNYGICSAMNRVDDDLGTTSHHSRHWRQTLFEHIDAILEEDNDTTSYLCTMAANRLGIQHEAHASLAEDFTAFGKFFRLHWLNLAIEAVAHNDDNALPPFFTKEQLEDLYVEFCREQS